MSIILNVIRYAILLTLVVLFASLFAEPTWNLYISVYHEPGGSWIDLHTVAALMLGYIFFLPFFFAMLGEKRRAWLIALGYVPIVFFELTSDFYGLSLFVGIGIAGTISGSLIRMIAANTLGKMPALEPLKKYF